MKRPAMLAIGLVLVVSSFGFAQGPPRRATVATTKGDTIEGTLKSITDTALTIEIAGVAVSIPMSDVTYLSFTGKLGAGGSGPDASSALDRAMTALKRLRSVVEIGVLRDQYSTELINTLPVVREFTKTDDGEWVDVKLALESAIEEFQSPLSSVSAWSNASAAMGRAGAWSDDAATLAAIPSERNHRESRILANLALGSSVDGRLGAGDQILPRSLDRNFSDGFSDVYTLDLPTAGELSIVMKSTPCMAHITLTDAADKKLEGDGLGARQEASIKRKLPAGSYHIWASAEARKVCRYELSATSK